MDFDSKIYDQMIEEYTRDDALLMVEIFHMFKERGFPVFSTLVYFELAKKRLEDGIVGYFDDKLSNCDKVDFLKWILNNGSTVPEYVKTIFDRIDE